MGRSRWLIKLNQYDPKECSRMQYAFYDVYRETSRGWCCLDYIRQEIEKTSSWDNYSSAFIYRDNTVLSALTRANLAPDYNYSCVKVSGEARVTDFRALILELQFTFGSGGFTLAYSSEETWDIVVKYSHNDSGIREFVSNYNTKAVTGKGKDYIFDLRVINDRYMLEFVVPEIDLINLFGNLPSVKTIRANTAKYQYQMYCSGVKVPLPPTGWAEFERLAQSLLAVGWAYSLWGECSPNQPDGSKWPEYHIRYPKIITAEMLQLGRDTVDKIKQIRKQIK